MSPVLRLCEDVLSNGGAMELPALPRMIFVMHGSIMVGDRILRDEETFGGEGAVLLKAGSAGAMLWRWEFMTHEADFGRDPASAVSSKAASASIPTAAPPLTVPAARGTRPARTACSRKPRSARRASSAS